MKIRGKKSKRERRGKKIHVKFPDTCKFAEILLSKLGKKRKIKTRQEITVTKLKPLWTQLIYYWGSTNKDGKQFSTFVRCPPLEREHQVPSVAALVVPVWWFSNRIREHTFFCEEDRGVQQVLQEHKSSLNKTNAPRKIWLIGEVI